MACLLCRIVAGVGTSPIIYRDEEFVCIPDIGPIRRGHSLIFPQTHVETFEELDPGTTARLLNLGQRLARAQKALYGVDRVAFLFAGGDVPHVHAHLVPMVEQTDITSRRYIEETNLTFRPIPDARATELADTAAELRAVLDQME